MKEIVGAKIGNRITNNPKIIVEAVSMDIPIQWLDRKHMEFMEVCDLGERWTKMAKGSTLFCMDSNNKVFASIVAKKELV